LPTLITTAPLASPVDYCTAHAPRARESLYFLRSELPSLFHICSSLDLRRLACLIPCLALQLQHRGFYFYVHSVPPKLLLPRIHHRVTSSCYRGETICCCRDLARSRLFAHLQFVPCMLSDFPLKIESPLAGSKDGLLQPASSGLQSVRTNLHYHSLVSCMLKSEAASSSIAYRFVWSKWQRPTNGQSR